MSDYRKECIKGALFCRSIFHVALKNLALAVSACKSNTNVEMVVGNLIRSALLARCGGMIKERALISWIRELLELGFNHSTIKMDKAEAGPAMLM